MASTPLVPVIKRTSTRTVVDQLLRLIREGTWKVGDRLPSEKELVEQLGVGRSTVREALQNLAAVNVIESSPGQRTVVKAPSPSEIFRSDLVGLLISDSAVEELLEMRTMIEPDCARLAAERASDETLDAIEHLLDAHEREHLAGGPVASYGARFHLAVARAAGNRVAAAFMESILDILTDRAMNADRIVGARAREIADHRMLLRLMRRREPERAAEAMREHILTWADIYNDNPGACR